MLGGPPPPPPRHDLRFSNKNGILQKKKTMWFIGVEVEKKTRAPPPNKNPGSAPVLLHTQSTGDMYYGLDPLVKPC